GLRLDFFFSSRRRHTRFSRDWSSDVCSSDLAMRDRDETTMGTLRMALAAVKSEEVAGKEARELSDDEVIAVLSREAKKRREAAEAYRQGERPELAERELAEEDR